MKTAPNSLWVSRENKKECFSAIRILDECGLRYRTFVTERLQPVDFEGKPPILFTPNGSFEGLEAISRYASTMRDDKVDSLKEEVYQKLLKLLGYVGRIDDFIHEPTQENEERALAALTELSAIIKDYSELCRERSIRYGRAL